MGNFIANVFYDRAKAPPEKKRKRIGKIWYDREKERGAVLMNGIRVGPFLFAAKPFDNIEEPPYLAGDLCVQTGAYENADGVQKKEYLWCGHIQSQQDPAGNTIYFGVIEVIPLLHVPAGRPGIFLSIFRDEPPPEEKEPEPAEVEEEEEDDPIPF